MVPSDTIQVPPGLLESVLGRIALARRRAARIRLAAFGTVTFVSVLMLVPAVQYAINEFYTSGFYDYASLFLDGLSRGYWRELLYSLVDSLPSLPLLLLALLGTAFVWSVRYANRNVKVALTRFASPA